ncbi:type II toxin-antitoxin system VapC family toxin [Saccharothrix sp. BKS2]|uniref:type II toxin-antitoxin system VapC family toxin n=1 Tax=Saccharothrix sp. BKS2 TaxID=3064400 RepID=UPI0039EB0ABA
MKPNVVVDSSALIEIVANKAPDQALVHRLASAEAATPALLDAEVLSVFRRLERAGHLSREQATAAVVQVLGAPVERFPLRPLAWRAWELRHAVFAYDAFYLALAEELVVPLVTCDEKLAGSNGHQVDIEVYPVS